MITILLLVQNGLEQIKRAVESIRTEKTGIDISVILIDNPSTPEIAQWATEQEDISYAGFDQGVEPWGSVLNQVKSAFQLDSDLLVMQSRYVLLPDTISEMRQLMYSQENIGIVSCLRSGDESVLENGRSMIDVTGMPEQVMCPGCGLFILKRELMNLMGNFQDNIVSLFVLFQDIALHMIDLGYRAYICYSALAYEQYSEYPENIDTLIHMEADKGILEELWKMHYFNMIPNTQLTELIDAGKDDRLRVLEIGCDCGATLLDIKNRFPNAYTYGCDIAEKPILLASHYVDEAFVTNIENEDIPIEKGSLDYIIIGDVLEHLHFPDKTLLYLRSFLKEDGVIVASIPNFMHISVMKQLLKGNFTYTESGLLDKTHIHMFTYNEIQRIFQKCGYELEKIHSHRVELDREDFETIDQLLRIDDTAKRFMYETFQFLVRARKKESTIEIEHKTSFVIVSYNQLYLTQKCVESIRENCPPGTFTMIFIDNASTDGSVEWLEQQSDIRLIKNNENIGFTKACNQGILAAPKDEDIMFLNNDTRMTKDALYWLQKALYSDEKVGAVGCVSNYAGKGQQVDVEFQFPENYMEYAKKVNIPMEEPYKEQGILCGFAMLIKREILDLVGGMDEMFSPGYYEDTDLSLRIGKKGYRLLVCKNSFIYHAGSQSFRTRDDLEEIQERNMQYLISKWGLDYLTAVLQGVF